MFSNHSFGSLRRIFFLSCPIRVSVDYTKIIVHEIIFLLFFPTSLDDEKCCRNCIDPGTKIPKQIIFNPQAKNGIG